MAETVDLSLALKLDALKRGLSQLDNITQKEIKKTVRDAAKEWSKLRKTGKSTGKGLADGVKGATDQVKKLGEVAQGSLGGVLGRLGGVAELFMGLGTVGGPVTLAIAAVGAYAVGVGAVGAAMVSTVFAAEDLLDRQKELAQVGVFAPIDPEAEASILQVNDAMDALGMIWDRIVVDIASSVAPAIDDLAVTLVTLALQAEDMFRQFAQGKNLLREFAVFVVDNFIQSIFGTVSTFLELLDLVGQGLSALGATGVGEALSGINDAFESMTRGAAEYVVDGVGGAVVSSLDAAGDGAKDFRAEAQVLIAEMRAGKVEAESFADRMKRLADEEKRAADEAKRLAEAEERRQRAYQSQIDTLRSVSEELSGGLREANSDLLNDEGRIQEAYNERIRKLEGLADSLMELGEAGQDVSKELALVEESIAAAAERRTRDMAALAAENLKAAQEASKKQAIEAAALFDAQSGLVESMASAVLENVGTLAEGAAEKSKAAQMVALIAQKASSLLQIGISTAENISAAAALFAFPSPPGIAAVSAAGALGALQVATVAATPTSFHQGGTAPDEGFRRFQGGEGVLSRQGMDALARLNSGLAGMSGDRMVVIQPDHRVFDVQTKKALRSRNSPLRRAVAKKSRRRR